MTRRRKTDYDVVFKKLLQILDDNQCFESVVIDFEAAVWQSVKEIFPSVELHGCHFHFAQAVYKNVQSFGLVSEYKKRQCLFFDTEAICLTVFTPFSDNGSFPSN